MNLFFLLKKKVVSVYVFITFISLLPPFLEGSGPRSKMSPFFLSPSFDRHPPHSQTTNRTRLQTITHKKKESHKNKPYLLPSLTHIPVEFGGDRRGGGVDFRKVTRHFQSSEVPHTPP